jgi:hypothetical protein
LFSTLSGGSPRDQCRGSKKVALIAKILLKFLPFWFSDSVQGYGSRENRELFGCEVRLSINETMFGESINIFPDHSPPIIERNRFMVRAIHSSDGQHDGEHGDDKLCDAQDSSKRVLFYTPVKATKTLPLVRRVVKDLLSLAGAINQQQIQLDGFHQLGETIEQAAYREELDDVEQSLTAEKAKWQQCVGELTAIGVSHHVPFDGTIDFPAMLDRRPIRLCWRPGDESVQYWHEVNETSADRKKIDFKMLPTLAS